MSADIHPDGAECKVCPDMEAWGGNHCYHCGRSIESIETNGPSQGCICDPDSVNSSRSHRVATANWQWTQSEGPDSWEAEATAEDGLMLNISLTVDPAHDTSGWEWIVQGHASADFNLVYGNAASVEDAKRAAEASAVDFEEWDEDWQD